MIGQETFQGRLPTKPLSEVAEFLDHQRRPITASNRESGPYPYYGANGQQDSVADFIFDEPLVLLAEDGGSFDNPDRGIAYAIEGKTWVNNHAHVLRPKRGVALRYLLRVLENYDVRPWINGTTRAKLTKGAASRIEIPLPHKNGKPDLDEQKRIAAILDKADAIRRQRQQALRLTDDFLRSVFLDMFGDPVTNPKGWPISKSGEIFADKPRLGTTRPATGTGYLVVRVGEIGSEIVNFGKCGRVELSEEELKRFRLLSGDILIARAIGSRDQLGKCSFFHGHEEVVVGDSHVMRLRLDPKKCEPYWFYFLLSSPTGKLLLQSKGGATAVQFNINSTQASDLEIPVPPLSLQSQFVRIAQATRRKSLRDEESTSCAEAFFGSLQQRAFRGEL